MLLKEIIEQLEAFSPPHLAESWDNVGLMLGHPMWNIQKCYVALDITDAVIEFAIQQKCQLIVTHHPFLMSGLKSINLEDPKCRQIATLLNHNIAVYSMHTNFDSCQQGVNDHLCELLKLRDYHTDEPSIFRKGFYQESITLREFISRVKDVLGVSYVNYTGDLNRQIQSVAVVGGSGGSMVAEMADCDVYLTGEAKYHEYQLAETINLCMVTAGHFETEAPALDTIRSLLRDLSLEVVTGEQYLGFYQTV
ncbi:MAG: Nif3-like dinuclear metal center hexameric protein [Clostridia bacterium]|nr:Nif3-like dinuclear metal center hexameric protein [Clostridia bacterium]